MTQAYAVLRSGGDFKPEHVKAIAECIPGIIVLSDVNIEGVKTIPLKYNWPGWFSKMELFSPEIKGDIFYLDLDTVIVDDIYDLMSIGKTTMLSDFYFPDRPASGLMYVTESDREKVWGEWIKCPYQAMVSCGTLGDQKIIGDVLNNSARWQNEFPNRVISYKMHVCKTGSNRRAIGNGFVPDGASVICFHGKPRPWDQGVRLDKNVSENI